jgi:hypothetical protein
MSGVDAAKFAVSIPDPEEIERGGLFFLNLFLPYLDGDLMIY